MSGRTRPLWRSAPRSLFPETDCSGPSVNCPKSPDDGRLGSYVAGSTPWPEAADTRSRRAFIAENHSSTALLGCLWAVGSALAATATTGAVAQHWLSWMSERSARLVAGKPDWAWGSARGPRRSEYPPKSSP